MDANGDGIGDFPGLMRRLDYLHGLGITAIWLMPFQPSPYRDDGYDISDYYGVNSRHGTLGDFVEFTHGAEQRGIRVIMEWREGASIILAEANVLPENRYGIFWRRRRSHAHDVQFSGQSEFVLRIGSLRLPAAGASA